MRLQTLLGNINSAPTTKTASAAPAPRAGVMDAITAALAEAETVKTASTPENTPAGQLEKMASEVVASNRDAELQHAEKIGAAMADSYVRQLAAYEAASEKIAMEKAAEMNVTAEELQMVMAARQDPQGFLAKVAEQAQYQEYQNEKIAAEVWDQTAQDTVRAIHKTAMDHYAAGYGTIIQALQG